MNWPVLYPSEQLRKAFSELTRWLFEGLMLLAIVVMVSYWQTRDVPFGSAPQFEAPLADGRMVSLASWRAAHPGKPVLLHFWADWCSVCKIVSGSVDDIARDWPVLTVAMRSGDAAAVRRHLEASGHDWATAIDEDGRIARDYSLYAMPAFVILDSAGTIRFAEMGYTSELGLRFRLWWLSIRPRLVEAFT